MTRETNPNTSYIGNFSETGGVVDYPETDGSLLISELDDQIRDAKQMIYNTLKNCDGEVTATHTELNKLDGQVQNVAVALTGKTASGLAVATQAASTYTLTTGESVTLADGDRYTFQVNAASVGNDLLKVDSNTAYNLIDKNAANVGANDFPANAIIEVIYVSSTNKFYVLSGFTNVSQVASVYVYSAPGSYTFTGYDGDATFYAIGAGGGGGGDAGAGGGGGYIAATLTLTSTDSVSLTVGAGGTSMGYDSDGNDGGDSEFTFSGVTYTGGGGSGGECKCLGGGGTGNGGAGGVASTSGGVPVSNTKYTGGAGGGGDSTGLTYNGCGGAGAGSSGNGGAGGNSSNTLPSGGDAAGGAAGGQYGVSAAENAGPPTATGPEGGGGGFGQENNTGSDGEAGAFPGGGGGAGDRSAGPGGAGGTGGDGIIVVVA